MRIDPIPIDEPEILIRYGRVAPHARDRVLDQFYLTYHQGSSLGTYLFFKTVVLLAAFLSIAMPIVCVCIWLSMLLNLGAGDTMSLIFFVVSVFELLFFSIILSKRSKTRHKELPFQATELGLTASRIYVHSRAIHGGYVKSSIRWQDITSVALIEKHENGFLNTYINLLDINSKSLSLQLDCIQTIEERQILRDCLLQFVTQADVRPAAMALIQAGKEDDVPFTRLWSQALQDSRPRINTEPLENDALLQAGCYRIKDRIGSGGQGAVYLADMRTIDGSTEVVLKEYVLPDRSHEQEHKSAVEQFEKEVRLLNKIHHPGVIKLYNAFVEDHRAYLVIEHCRGISLKQTVEQNGPMQEERAVRLASDLCDILDALHSMSPSILHLDFSPENILLSSGSDGTDKLTVIDFNVSVEENSIRTRTVMGKQRYMAPEQYRGKPTTRSDIYSLGASLYFLLTGVEPEPITVAKLAKVISNPNPALAGLLVKSTALEEEERIQSAREFKEALREIYGAVQPPQKQDSSGHRNEVLALAAGADNGDS